MNDTPDVEEEDEFPFADHFRNEMARVKAELDISPGDLYEDCCWHPRVCVEIDYDRDAIRGISLINGTHPGECSLRFCGVRKLSVAEAWEIRRNGPPEASDRE